MVSEAAVWAAAAKMWATAGTAVWASGEWRRPERRRRREQSGRWLLGRVHSCGARDAAGRGAAHQRGRLARHQMAAVLSSAGSVCPRGALLRYQRLDSKAGLIGALALCHENGRSVLSMPLSVHRKSMEYGDGLYNKHNA